MAMLAAAAPYLPQALGAFGAYKASQARPKQAPAIPMPDEEMIRKSQRRSAGARRGGRASTILTGTEDGLGG